MIHHVIPTKYQKYFSTTILEHANFLAKVNKSPQEHLHNMTSHDAYSITINVSTATLAVLEYESEVIGCEKLLKFNRARSTFLYTRV